MNFYWQAYQLIIEGDDFEVELSEEQAEELVELILEGNRLGYGEEEGDFDLMELLSEDE